MKAFSRSGWGGMVVLSVACLAIVLLLATPVLIQPFPASAAWFDSAASFPRAALAVAILAALFELTQRMRKVAPATPVAGSEELDSSEASLPLALGALLIFGLYVLAVPVLGFALSTFFFLGLCAWWVKLPRMQGIVLAFFLPLALWLVFVKVLKVSFGHGWLF